MGEDALGLLDGIDELVVAKGKKTVRLDLANDRPSDEEILDLVLGRTGKLRAPVVRTGSRLLVGFNQDVLEELA